MLHIYFVKLPSQLILAASLLRFQAFYQVKTIDIETFYKLPKTILKMFSSKSQKPFKVLHYLVRFYPHFRISQTSQKLRKSPGSKPQKICHDIPFFGLENTNQTHQKSNSFGKRRAKCKDLKEHLINLVKKLGEVAQLLLRLPLIIGCNRLCTKVQWGTKLFADCYSK